MRASPLASLAVSASLVLAAGGHRPRASRPAPPDSERVALLRSAALACRKAAGSLRDKAAECEKYLAGGNKRKCAVTYNSSSGERRETSVEGAGAIAGQFEATAAEFDKKAAAVQTLQERLQGLQDAIRRLGLDKREDDFAEWEELSKDAQEEFEKNTLDALFTAALEGAKVSLAAVGSFDAQTARKMIIRLKAAGVNDPRLFEGIRKLAAARNKAERAATASEVLERLNRLRESAEVAKTSVSAAVKNPSVEGNVNATLEAIATVLGWANKQPALALLTADIKFTTYSIFNNATRRVSQEQIQQLLKLTEAQLADLKLLTKRVKDTVRSLKAESQTLPAPCELK